MDLADRVTVVIATRRDAPPERSLLHARALVEKPRVALARADSLAAARNAGAREARTPYVAFCDDDSWWAAGALPRAAELLDDYPRLALVAACVLVGAEHREEPACRELGQSPLAPFEHPGRPVVSFLAGAVLMRRSSFLQVGGFQERLCPGGEEALLALDLLSAGWRMCYVPDIQVHRHPEQPADAGEGRRRLARALRLAWLRRPASSALARTFLALRLSVREPGLAGAVLEALGALPWIVRERKVVPRSVEDALRQVERSRGR